MKFRERFRIEPGSKVKLSRHDPDDTAGYKGKSHAVADLRQSTRRLQDLQYLLYAEGRRALLVVLQAMDAGGKDGVIRHVMGPLNPQGCRVTSFKQPTAEELAHDFLWRIHKATPRAGEMGVFNRSHYEDVLVVRVRGLAAKAVWSKRYEQINAFEKTLAAADVHVVKFFLHISRDEQRKRLQARLADPARHWKFDPQDLEERKLWDEYEKAYEAALSKCSTARAPWYVIPANHKWFRNLAISQILVETLESLDMKYPPAKVDISKVRLD